MAGTGKTIERNGAVLAYEVTGQGPPIILGHSYLLNRDMWRPQVDAVSDRFRVINVDFRGHGASAPSPTRFTVEDLVDDCLAILDAENADAAVWCGLSVGGMVAMRAALNAPARVTALILADTDAESWGLRERAKYGAMGMVARVGGMKPISGAVARTMFGATTRRTKPELVAAWRRHFAGAESGPMLAFLGALRARRPLLDSFSAIQCPTLIIHGEEDAAIPPERAQRMHERIAGSRLEIIPDAGHISSLEQPEAVTARIKAFLDGLS